MRYPLDIAVRPSRRICALLIAIHGIAIAALFLSSLAYGIRTALVVVACCSLGEALRREWHKSRLTLILRDDGVLGCVLGQANCEARVMPGSADFGFALWLHLSSADGAPLPSPMQHLMLMPDSMPQPAWRPLRIWLRHKAAAARFSDSAAV